MKDTEKDNSALNQVSEHNAQSENKENSDNSERQNQTPNQIPKLKQKPIDSTLPFIPPLKYPVDPQPQMEPSPLEAPLHVKQPEELLPESDDPWEKGALPKLRRSPFLLEEEGEEREEREGFDTVDVVEPSVESTPETPETPEIPELLEGPTTVGKRLIPQKTNEAMTKKTAEGKRVLSSDTANTSDSTALTPNKTAFLRKNLLDTVAPKEEPKKQTRIPSTLKQSLINLKEPNIVLEKKVTSLPLEEDTPAPKKGAPTSAFAQASKEKKESRPLIQLVTPQIQVQNLKEKKDTKDNLHHSIYEEAFETEHLPPVFTPPEPEPEPEPEEVEDSLPIDDPLYDFITSLKEPLPTERFSPSFLKQTGAEEEDIPEEGDFAKLLASIAEGEANQVNKAHSANTAKTANTANTTDTAKSPILPPLPPNHPRARAPYKEESPLDIMKSWFDVFKKPKEKETGAEKKFKTGAEKKFKTGEQKQYEMVAKMVGLSCILGFFVMLPQLIGTVGTASVVATVQIDVNPSILIEVTSKNTVTSVTPLNEEGLLVLGASEFTDKPLEEVLHSLTDLLVLFGFLQETSTVLATVEDDNQSRGESLSVNVKGYLDDALKDLDVSAVAVGLWVDPDFKHQENAKNMGVSLGKYVLMYEINQIHSLFPLEDLKDFTQEELYQLYVLGNNSLPIGIESAVALSRQAVLLSELDTYITQVSTNLLEETPHYQVLFQTPTKEFVVQVEGFQGTVLDAQEYSAYNMSPDNAVLPIVAKTNAIDYVNVLEIQTSNLSITQDFSKGRLEYIVSFYVGDNRHTVTVLASTGDVLHHQQTEVQSGIVKDMGQSAIQALVFADAGVTKEQLSSISMNQEVVGDTLYYHLTFWMGTRQYSYDVQGDGSIIFTEYQDYGEAPVDQNSGIISETSAKDIALTHAGVSFSQAKNLTVNMTIEGQYVVTFYVDAVPFYYMLSSTTGDILAYEKEETTEEEFYEEEIVEEEIYNDIGEDGAKQVAVSASNLKEVMIQRFDITEQGSGMDKSYTVAFTFMSTEYIYTISAESGEILDTTVNAPELPTPTETTPTPAPEQTFEEVQQNFDSFADIFDQFNTNFSEAYQLP